MRTLITFAVFAGLAWFLAVWIPPRMAVVTVPEGFKDQSSFRAGERYYHDPLAVLRVGDVVAFRVSSGVAFAQVVALPGDEVRLQADKLLVNGKTAGGWNGLKSKTPMDLGPIVVPAAHIWALSSGHQYDSLAGGPISRGQIIGKVLDPP